MKDNWSWVGRERLASGLDRLGTLPSLSFSSISNLLGAMKELNSFATLSLPNRHDGVAPPQSAISALIGPFMGKLEAPVLTLTPLLRF